MFMIPSLRLLFLAAYVITYSAYNTELFQLSDIAASAFSNYLGAISTSLPSPEVSNESVEDNIGPDEYVTITLPHPGSNQVSNIQGKKYPQTTTFHNIKYAQSPTGNLR